MGCGHSKEDVETGHIHIKTKRKCKKSKEPKGENTQLIQQKEQKEEEVQNKSTHLEKNEETLDGELSIEGLICDGISGKTEYFSPKKSNLREIGHDDLNEDKEREFLNDENNRDLSIEQVICDGVSGKTEFYSPKRANDGVEKEGSNDDENDGNGNLSTEGVICDGCSGKTDYYSPKKTNDDVAIEDKEVLVEEKKGEAKKTEEASDEVLGEIEDVSSLKKSNEEVGEKDFPSKEKESEKETTVHVSGGYAFDTLLSWWKTREV